MKNKYNQAAEKITVTPEMEKRILHNISQVDFSATPQKAKINIAFTKVLSLAACFLVLIWGANLLLEMKPPVHVTPEIVEYESLSELSANIDFPIMVPEQLQGMKENSYTCFFKTIAQITYMDGNNIITYRMARGNEDISGDYTEYKEIKEWPSLDTPITLKGDEKGYHLATWTKGGFSFAISSVEPLTESDLLNIAFSVK